MVSRCLNTSEKWNALHRETPRLAEFAQVLYLLLITHSDDFGRQAGDSFTVKHAVVPASPRQIPAVETALTALHRVGLITWYESNCRKYIQINDFDAHQAGLHKRTESKFPESPGEAGDSRNVPPKRIVNGSEPKRSTAAEKPSDANRSVFNFIKCFCDLYREKLHGSQYDVKSKRDVPNVRALLKQYGHERLVKLATVMLLSDDEWIAGSDRGIGVLKAKDNWLEIRLREYEAEKR